MQLSYFNGFHCCHICIGKEVLCEINGMLEGHIYDVIIEQIHI